MKKFLHHSVIFCVIFFFRTVTFSFAQPVADFNVSVNEGCSSLRAQFTDLSTGNPSSWLWNFGDGQTSIAQNPSVTYTSPGVYSVSLTVQNSAGSNSITKTNYIVVDSFLTARFINIVSSGCIPLPVSFIDQSTPGSAAITSWRWNFGDGTTSDSTNPTHTYADTGTFNVTLIVSNAKGCRDTLTGTIATGIKPRVFFTTPLFDICASYPVQFQNRTKGIVTSWLWNFGDDDTSTKKSPLHYFTDTGFIKVKLTAAYNGCSDSFITHDLHIKPPVAKIRGATFSCDNPYLIDFQAKYRVERDYNSYWDFGDGTTSTDKYPQHTYSNKGTYLVKLSAPGTECSYTDSITINVIDENPSFAYNSSHASVCKLDTVHFIATNYDTALIHIFKWDYGDEDTATDFSSLNAGYHTYKNTGTFSVSLITGNISECYDTITKPVNIHGPKAAFTNNAAACVDNTVNFTDQSTSDGTYPVTKWIWDYGDGTMSTLNGPPFTHVYKRSDTFTVKLKIADSNGCEDTLTKPGVLVTIPNPVAAFTVDTLNCLNNPVSFSDNSTGQLLGRIWYFGDGDTSTQMAPKHVYLSTGDYTPTLIIGNQAGCSDTLKKFVHVLPLPNVDAGVDSSICLGQSVVLHASGASRYVWAADASLNCTACANPVAKPQVNKIYYVTGTDAFGCTASDSLFIEVKQPVALLVKRMDTVCYGSSIQLNASGAEVYYWQPSTGLSSINIPDPVATPLTTTTYTLKGADTKNCFFDTASITVVVAPHPQFNIVDTNVTLGAGSTYVIKTTSSPDIIKWQWSPPINLSCTNCPQPIVTGNKFIQYTGVASNAAGCSDSDKIIIKAACSSDLVFIPNTFSPNGDGNNDRFYPRGPGIYLIKSMRIFNRLGQIIFEKKNFQADVESEGWDGTMHSKKLPEDVYIYFIEVICNNGTIIAFKGDIALL
ncbi:MAG TPA: PKD domain-containing protein [Chitinophagaceae bacterium]